MHLCREKKSGNRLTFSNNCVPWFGIPAVIYFSPYKVLDLVKIKPPHQDGGCKFKLVRFGGC